MTILASLSHMVKTVFDQSGDFVVMDRTLGDFMQHFGFFDKVEMPRNNLV
jgi:hypothetical protein